MTPVLEAVLAKVTERREAAVPGALAAPAEMRT
jgi:hypothetical protein